MQRLVEFYVTCESRSRPLLLMPSYAYTSLNVSHRDLVPKPLLCGHAVLPCMRGRYKRLVLEGVLGGNGAERDSQNSGQNVVWPPIDDEQKGLGGQSKSKTFQSIWA